MEKMSRIFSRKKNSGIVSQERRWQDRLYNIGCMGLKVICFAVFLFLCRYAFFYTQDIRPGDNEIPLDYADSVFSNIAVLFTVIFLYLGLNFAEKKLSTRAQLIISRVFLVMTVVFVLTAGFWWIYSAERIPQADQACIYAGASYFLEGNYSMLGKGCYYGVYPYQLGLAFIVQILFSAIGPFQYFAYEFWNGLFAGGIAVFGYLITQKIGGRMGSLVIYCLAMQCCIPLVCYTHWVYGEIPGVFFLLAACHCLLCYKDSGKIRNLVGIVVFVTVASLYRKNSAIFAFAILIIAIFEMIRKKNYKLFAGAVCAFILPFLVYEGIYTYYEHRSGIQLSYALPTVTWFAMGLEDDPGRGPGWYNNVIQTYRDMGCDNEALEQLVKEQLKERLEYMAAHPVYAVNYMKRKLLTQWNEPLYESVYFGTKYDYEYIPDNEFLIYITAGEGYNLLLEISDRLQMVVFAGMLLYCLFGISKNGEMTDYVLMITILGGFLFSMIWEGKARYIFPYYMLMFPMFSVGYQKALKWLGKGIKHAE